MGDPSQLRLYRPGSDSLSFGLAECAVEAFEFARAAPLVYFLHFLPEEGDRQSGSEGHQPVSLNFELDFLFLLVW